MSKQDEGTEHCEQCGEALQSYRVVWLELSQTDSRYYGYLPPGHTSQGGFPFGRDCARKVLSRRAGEKQ